MEARTPATAKSRAKQRTMKSHRKSRAGCFTCKGRRIKCCEQRPVCTNCRNGALHCVYPEAQPRSICAQPGGVQYQSRGFSLKDMRFFHDFMTASYPHLPLNTDHVWTTNIPLLAQEYEFLMHAILAVGASHLHRNTDLELSGTVVRHRDMALRGLIEPSGSQKTTISESHLNAKLAAAFALQFTASYMQDPINTFLILLRSIASFSGQIMDAGYSSPLFMRDGWTIAEEDHTEHMRRRLQSADWLPPHPVAEVEQAKQSLEMAARFCKFTRTELKVWNILQETLEKFDDPVEAYFCHTKNWNMFAMMKGKDFTRFADPSCISSVVLQTHFLAIDRLLKPWSVVQLPEQRTTLGLCPIEPFCVFPSYTGTEDRDLGAKLLEWPVVIWQRGG